MKRLVVDLMSTIPHLRLPASARARLIARAPAGWEAVVIDAPTVSAGDGTNRVSDETLATVTTHDLPTAAGFLVQEHVRVRAELGQLSVPVTQERARALAERAALMSMLEQSGLLSHCAGDPVLAMHAVLAAASSRLVLAAYGDAVGDLRQPNLPGTVEAYPNWRLPVADASGRPLGLEELLLAPGVRRLSALLSEGVGGSLPRVG